MAGDLGPRGREAEPPEEPARLPLADVALGALVGLGARDADGVEAELGSAGAVARLSSSPALLQRIDANPSRRSHTIGR